VGDEYVLGKVVAAEEARRKAEAQRARAHDLLQGLRHMKRPERKAWIRDFLRVLADSGYHVYGVKDPPPGRPKR